MANRQAHIETTGPEIWDQTDGKVDGFICAVGSGGTLAGVAEALQPRGVKIGLADPEGAGMFKIYTGRREPRGLELDHRRHRAGADHRQPRRLHPDDVLPDPRRARRCPIVFDLLAEEGLCLGGSSGINIAGAIRLAREMGPGHTIVTILCDYGTRYQSKLFNPEFLREKGPAGARMAGRAARRPAGRFRGRMTHSARWLRSAGLAALWLSVRGRLLAQVEARGDAAAASTLDYADHGKRLEADARAERT